MKRPTIEQLHTSGQFRLIESFSIDEMTQFIVRELGLKQTQPSSAPRKLTWRSALMFLGMAGIGGVFGFFIGNLAVGKEGSGPALWQLVGTIPFLLLLLAIHEAIHALVFLGLGARDVGFGFSKQGLMIYAYSQRFVMSLRENALVAVMPFVVITAALVMAVIFLPDYRLLLIVSLLLHAAGCMGDFAIIRHWWRNRQHAMFTYDDLTEKRTYFFEKTTLVEAQSTRSVGTETALL